MNYKDIYRRPPISEKGFVIQFGKHRGLTIEQLMDDDPQYLQWCIDKDMIKLDHILLDLFEDKNPWLASGDSQARIDQDNQMFWTGNIEDDCEPSDSLPNN